ncbi:MAG: response regulator [Peptococcaceae bacterium]|jgi:PAS domain S-box-containing protein|nr:response regulator [Peptococcaceae bacterium]
MNRINVETSAAADAARRGETGEPAGLAEELEALRKENAGLQTQLRKVNRQFSLQQKDVARFEKISATRDRLASVLKDEQSKQEKFLNMMLGNSSNIIILLDDDGRFAYCTDTFLTLAGIQNFGLIDGRHYSEVFGRFHNDVFLKHVESQISKAVAEHQTILTEEALDLSGSGQQTRVYNTNTTAMRNEEGVVEGIMMLFHDITETLRAKEAAEAANRAKSEFLASMSHEIRTPLNAVNGLAELELRKDLPQETLANLEKIYGSGVTLLNIINDILDISKIESGRFELLPIDYETSSIISDTVSMNIVRIGSKPIVFKLELDENLPNRLYGDELRVKQILNNLLSNAIKYTPEGVVALDISCERSGGDCWLICSVKDSGIGISKENIAKLFSDYQQVDMQSHRTIEGTGLGLSICKRLVEMMEGTIHVESEYGKGSVFTVRLKQMTVDPKPIGPENTDNLKNFRFLERQSRRVKNIDYVSMPYGKVLIVDDVQTNLDVAKGMMMAYDLTIHCVTSGRQAIELVRDAEVRYDIIFMDHMMPEMDGIEAVRIIRQEVGSDYAKTVPIVALTANAIIGNDKLFLENGFQAFLSKPIDVIRLDAVLHRWIRDRQSPDTLQKAETEAQAPKGAGKAERLELLSNMLQKNRVKGVDFSSGMRRFNNNPDVYLRVIRSFIQNMPRLLDELRDVTESSLAKYAITVHGVKGSCYGISADEAGKMAEALEVAAKTGDFPRVMAGNNTFIQTAEALLPQFEALLKSADAVKTAESRNAASAPDPELLTQMLEASKDYDIDAMQQVMEQLEQYSYESGNDLIEWLKEQVTNFGYDQIQEKLESQLIPAP